ncbi:type VI secretion system contractile sheath small subunit [Acetobacteraceae bacterium]|nr:type VI secretion system contractile sheath small subunit [Acetobacteraceae bacterium]
MNDSIHNKLSRVRKPRVHITYEVETEGAEKTRELPFVVGVMGDFAGDSTKSLRPYNERRFVQIDSHNFNEVMSKMSPSLKLEVPNTIKDDGSTLKADLSFEKMEDFEPLNIVEQVPELKKLLETRNRLRDLLSKADRSQELEQLLEHILQNKDEMKSLSHEVSNSKED